MLGLLLLYWIGKKFHELAKNHGRKPAGPIILAIVLFYLGQFILGLTIGIIYELQGNDVDSLNDFVINLIGIPVGLAVTYGYYKFLEKKYSKVSLNNDDILDDAVIIEEQKP